ncbi:MAG: CCA tRNA nucleotidyltransferase [Pseudomonadota bacterium]
MEGVTLPDAPWRHSTGLGLLYRTLGSDAGLVRLVGGVVRDGLAGQAVTDIDLATSLSPAEVVRRLEAAKFKAIPTGLAHGTVTAVISSGAVEITTLRRDVATDGRHATVTFTDDWQEDAARRDFTINALSADPFSGAVFDYFGGVDDLIAGRVAFIGDPLQRIAEDHLRIMRFFRFHARYGRGAPDAAAIAACSLRANDLMALSRERIADELLKILALPDPGGVIALMVDQGIFKPVLPEIADAAPLARLIARECEAGIAGDPMRRLSALLAPVVGVAEDIAARLKLSNAKRKRLAVASARLPSDAADPQELAYWVGHESAADRLLLGDGDARALSGWAVPTLPISGGAIVSRGIKAGPDVARILKAIERQWVEEGFPDQTRVAAIADSLVVQSLSPTTRGAE